MSRLRPSFICMVALVGLIAARVSPAVEPPNPTDLTQGNWVLQRDLSKFCDPSKAPQQSGRTILDEGYGLVSVRESGINAAGKPIDTRYVMSYDGRKLPAGVYLDPGVPLTSKESMTFHLINPHRVEFQHWSKDNKVTQKYVRTVSADGQTMTQTGEHTNRPECVDVQVFRRQ